MHQPQRLFSLLALAATIVSASAVAKAVISNGEPQSNHARYIELTSCSGGCCGGGSSGGGDNGGNTGGTCSVG